MIVQIIGKHPSVADTPVIEGAVRWIINSAYEALGDAWDVLFEMHTADQVAQVRPRMMADLESVTGKRRICLYGELRGFEAYPLDALRQFFADGELERSFQSSLDFMMALAIYEGATEIHLHGAELRARHEYMAQRESFKYWMGQARGRGIHVTVPEASGLNGAHFLYGYELDTGRAGPPGESVIVYGVPGGRTNPRSAVA